MCLLRVCFDQLRPRSADILRKPNVSDADRGDKAKKVPGLCGVQFNFGRRHRHVTAPTTSDGSKEVGTEVPKDSRNPRVDRGGAGPGQRCASNRYPKTRKDRG